MVTHSDWIPTKTAFVEWLRGYAQHCASIVVGKSHPNLLIRRGTVDTHGKHQHGMRNGHLGQDLLEVTIIASCPVATEQ